MSLDNYSKRLFENHVGETRYARFQTAFFPFFLFSFFPFFLFSFFPFFLKFITVSWMLSIKIVNNPSHLILKRCYNSPNQIFQTTPTRTLTYE